MNMLQRIARQIIEITFRISIRAVEQFYERTRFVQQARDLEGMPDGSLGKDISNCLKRHGLRPLPYYEDHDLKHVLLNFDMTPVDEIRLQAFMIGNGNHSPAAFALFLFGAILLPDVWSIFYEDFKAGRTASPISTWNIRDLAYCQTTSLREMIFSPEFAGAASHRVHALSIV